MPAELKSPEERFPEQTLLSLGYHAIWQGQKSWNDVAIFSRYGKIQETRRGLNGDIIRLFCEAKCNLGGINHHL